MLLGKLKLWEHKEYSNQTTAIFQEGEQNYENYKQRVIDDMHKIGYELENISLFNYMQFKGQSDTGTAVRGIEVKERDLNFSTPHLQMSSGMFRALSLIIQLNYSILENLPYDVRKFIKKL